MGLFQQEYNSVSCHVFVPGLRGGNAKGIDLLSPTSRLVVAAHLIGLLVRAFVRQRITMCDYFKHHVPDKSSPGYHHRSFCVY